MNTMDKDVCEVCGEPTAIDDLHDVDGTWMCAACAEGCGEEDLSAEAEALHDRIADMKGDMRREGVQFDLDKYMEETLAVEGRRARQAAAPLVAEGYGKARQKRTQELPQNRIRMVPR